MRTIRFELLLLICLLALTPVAHAAQAPDAAVLEDALRGTPYEGYTRRAHTFDTQYGEPGNRTAYAILARDGKNVLCAFEENEGGWLLRVANENAMYPGGGHMTVSIDEHLPLALVHMETSGGVIMLSFYIGSMTGAGYDWPLTEVLVVDGDDSTRFIAWEETGKWGILKGDINRFYADDADLRMDDFNLSAFPQTLEEADAIWHPSGTPVYLAKEDGRINDGLTRLSGREITLPADQTLAVYSGPGERYLRGAEGKAAVSTNGPLTLYALDQDWALISYEITGGERFGYIPQSALPKGVTAPALMEGPLSAGLTTREVAVLDNLSTPDAPLRVLPYESPLDVLARLGDWLYIDDGMTNGDNPCRGFIPADAFHHTSNF